MPPPPAPPSSWLLLIFENDANQRVWGAGGGGLVRLRAPRSLLQLPASPAPGADARPCPPDEAGSHYGGSGVWPCAAPRKLEPQIIREGLACRGVRSYPGDAKPQKGV